MPGLGDVNLAFSVADARTITDHGFHVILRPTNYSNPTKEQVAHFFDRADKIQNVSGIMFVGKEVLAIRRSMPNARPCWTIRQTT